MASIIAPNDNRKARTPTGAGILPALGPGALARQVEADRRIRPLRLRKAQRIVFAAGWRDPEPALGARFANRKIRMPAGARGGLEGGALAVLHPRRPA